MLPARLLPTHPQGVEAAVQAGGMSVPSAESILSDFETATYHARTARMVQLGRDPQNRAVLQELYEKHGFYGKQLALTACYGSRDVDLAKRSLQSTSGNIRDLALRILLDIASDDAVLLEVRANRLGQRPPRILSFTPAPHEGAQRVERIREENRDPQASQSREQAGCAAPAGGAGRAVVRPPGAGAHGCVWDPGAGGPMHAVAHGASMRHACPCVCPPTPASMVHADLYARRASR